MIITRISSRGFGTGLALSLSFAVVAMGDIISGVVTDFDTKAPISGVKVSAGAASALSGADGAYSLNTAATAIAIAKDLSLSGLHWDGSALAFAWDGSHGRVSIEVRGVRGSLLDRFESRSAGPGHYPYRSSAEGIQVVSVKTGRGIWRFRMTRVGDVTSALGEEMGTFPGSGSSSSSARTLAKAAAVNSLAYAKDGYNHAVQQVTGSQSNINVTLKKGAAVLKQASLTWYESYPDPGSDECIKYNGCTWAGQFAALSGKQPESWVKATNIAAVHSKDFSTYKLKTLRLQQGSRQIDVKVYDMCSDSDCDGCCTRNAGPSGFLIDIEKYTAERFGTRDGTVNWMCLDCN